MNSHSEPSQNSAPEIENHCCPSKKKKDYFFFSLVGVSLVFYFGHLLSLVEITLPHQIKHLFHHFFELINKMSLGIIIGIVFVGVLSHVPREYVISILGKPGSRWSLVRATMAGVLLDLCSHGILMVGMQLYRRGAGIGQVMAFLIASPWNSLSLTIILFTLIGIKYTLLFIFLSMFIGLITGKLFDILTIKKMIPLNPNQVELPDNFKLIPNLKKDLAKVNFNFKLVFDIIWGGVKESKIIVKWLLFGSILASLIKIFVDQGIFQNYFGPSLIGLLLTLAATTIIEVCSEGATPIAADLLTRANAPGNSFTFLMAGVATDYTEIVSIKETMKSWKISLLLPLLTVPQILILGYILNTF
ncbi:permease [Bacteriovoracaceae bacterium]|nr:permease [Bacteriovoracaceae bacterium]